MKICSKCNKEVFPGQVYCPRCGFSLIKNKYGERIGAGGIKAKIVSPADAVKINEENISSSSINSRNVFSSNNINKKNSYAIVISILMFAMVTLVPTIVSIFSIDDSVKVDDNIKLADVNNIIDDIKVLIDDNLAVRSSYADKSSTDLETIASITSLEATDLTNPWCTLIENYNTVDNAILCVVTAHDDNGDNLNAQNKLEAFNTDIANNKYSEYNLDSLNGIYDNLNNLYHLSLNSYDDYNTYREKYLNLNQTLKNYINSL